MGLNNFLFLNEILTKNLSLTVIGDEETITGSCQKQWGNRLVSDTTNDKPVGKARRAVKRMLTIIKCGMRPGLTKMVAAEMEVKRANMRHLEERMD